MSPPERELYETVTEYINLYLGGATGNRRHAVALARTVLQRRLASSLGAIHSSLNNRAGRLQERLDELEKLPPARRLERLAELRMIQLQDPEAGDDDADEDLENEAATAVTAAEHLDQLREEIVELRRLTVEAKRVMDLGEERKLGALRSCLQRAELAEVRDGRGKLLIFTEHRDTLAYLVGHLTEWGYSTCFIHGGHNVVERKVIQQDFHENKQICVATEAAGEGINLQFCHLMINYDLPWNPVRLDQRMGRIHRIGQELEVFVFNFCATNTVEGQLLERLHTKLEEMRVALGGRVYDVIGRMLDVNGLDFEQLVKDTLANPKRRDASLERISGLSAEKLQEYEQDVGIAQATRNIDLSWVRRRDWESEERRLMPEYVEGFFLDAAEQVRLRVDRRADGLFRTEHVPARLRSDDLESVRRLGSSQPAYRKLTFRKEVRDRAEHEDAVLLSPGHPLFAAVSELLVGQLKEADVVGASATFHDPATDFPYRIHFLTHELVAETDAGRTEPAYGELVAVIEEADGRLERAPTDVLFTLTPAQALAPELPTDDQIRMATNWVRARVQSPATEEERDRRLHQAELRSRYLEEAMTALKGHYERRWAEYDERVYRGEEQYRLLRSEMESRIAEVERRRQAKLEAFRRLGIVRPGAVAHLGSAWVVPPAHPEDPEVGTLRPDPAVEKAAMEFVMAYEEDHGRTPEDVSLRHDGSGFDIRSIDGDIVRRIEVKGRGAQRGDVGLYRTEWYAAERFRDGFWLYVVYDALSPARRLVAIQDPFGRLRDVRRIEQVTGFRVPAASIEECAGS